MFLQSLNEVQTWCREKNVPHIVILKDSEIGSARLKTWEKDRSVTTLHTAFLVL